MAVPGQSHGSFPLASSALTLCLSVLMGWCGLGSASAVSRVLAVVLMTEKRTLGDEPVRTSAHCLQQDVVCELVCLGH